MYTHYYYYNNIFIPDITRNTSIYGKEGNALSDAALMDHVSAKKDVHTINLNH